MIAVFAVLGGVVFALSNTKASDSKSENKVGATIFPIYDIVKQIAGDEFEVVLLLPPGTSPHTFDPQPSLLKDLQGAKLVFAIGYGLDTWSDSVAQSINASVVVVDQDVELRATEENDDHDEDTESHKDEDEDEYGHGPIDPHYWLSITNARLIASNIASELAERDSENASLYIDRAGKYKRELEVLETELRGKTANLSNRNIISLHDAWYYFADGFGLNLVGTFEPSAGKEPTPRYLANLEGEVREHNVSTLFIEPQLSTASIEAFADDHDLSIAIIDPLGGVPGRDSYVNLMRYNVNQVVNALNN